MEIVKVQKASGEKKLKFPLAKEYAGMSPDDQGLVVIFLDEYKGIAIKTPDESRHRTGQIFEWSNCSTSLWKNWHGEITFRF